VKHSPSPARFQPRFERGGCGVGFVADQHGRASHGLLRLAVQSLVNMQHRGGLDADACTGDGAGLLTTLPQALFAREAERLAGSSAAPGSLAVGVFFFQPGSEHQAQAEAEAAFNAHELELIAWRPVPVQLDVLGSRARATVPAIWHALLQPRTPASGDVLERHLYLARKQFERAAPELGAYVASCSARTIVYKGLLLAPQLGRFYDDLSDPDFEVPVVVFHQRYSTNTLPTWQRAQPFRMLCHNGEINTLPGNLAWIRAREPLLAAAWTPDAALLRPVADASGSDSAMLDNVVELLVRAGREIGHAITMLVPPAWEKMPGVPQSVRDFYDYHAGLTEPWDGPAALVFTDGRTVGAALDRNGLRPCRYLVTDEGLVAAASEAGAVPVPPESIRLRGRLGPGQMLAVDTRLGCIRDDGAIKQALAARRPYGAWLRNARRLSPARRNTDSRVKAPAGAPPAAAGLTPLQAAFGYTAEELVTVLRPMAETAAEAIGSMGDDTPPAVMSDCPRPLFAYFRQRFAEVTNPPIDPLRESLVMSLRVRLGARGNFLAETPSQARLLVLDSPCLASDELAALAADRELRAVRLSTLFRADEGAAGMSRALARLQQSAEAAVRGGAQALILSDRGVDETHSFIPSLLAVAAVHNHLLRAELRARAGLVVESGEPREVHHVAALIGYGAAAVNPWLALDTAADLVRGQPDRGQAGHRFLRAAEHGLLKVMSKMGISTADAYCGAQTFEILGLDRTVVDEYFTGTASHLGGHAIDGIAEIVLRWHAEAFGTPAPALKSPGFYKFKRSGEIHAYSPAVVHALHAAVKTPGALNGHWRQGYAAYKHYSRLQQQSAPVDLHDLLDVQTALEPLPLALVEPSQSILWRFSTAAMSHGALSAEAHATMAIAMNQLGAMSNSGEGGVDPARYGSQSNDRIKQVASARFGVTPEYLISADELQIKMAQGSKPGEGGQLPGHKVTAEIAAIRHATPGISLISPPPHHDIYSIEDLAQLIYDLRQVNPRAAISVKLVAQAGVGTIAVGVAKAGADVIVISGSSGGTGASPLSGIKYAGIPYELGLVEAQHMLSASGLRGRVRLRVDGGLRTGRDVVLAALLGADEFSFGTAAVVAEGCVMARACHRNTCPAGIATQREDLRAHFDATPEQVMAFMLYTAQEVREVLACMGLESLDQAVGRADLLRPAQAGTGQHPALDLAVLLAPACGAAVRHLGEPNRVPKAAPLNDRLLADWRRGAPHAPAELAYEITNEDRAFGASLAGEAARRFGRRGLTSAVAIRLTGSAGQSLGAFAVPGMDIRLCGEANDYVGKGLAGGRIVITLAQPGGAQVLAGNTVLYGATGGQMFIAGRAGERFAVRNSGALAVVEGVGDHGCEYMTGGTVVVLGEIGCNFAAGMTGGMAWLLDLPGTRERINTELVSVSPATPADLHRLRPLLEQHACLTCSLLARALLPAWETAPPAFLVITPKA
jgi:glutamate synthase (ferredoxin)